MSKRTKHQLLLVAFGVILFTLLMNFSSALALAGQLFSLDPLFWVPAWRLF